MTSNDEQIKQVTVRWPESFWDRAKIAAHRKRTSLQHALTFGCAAFLEIEPPAVDGDEPEIEPIPEPQKRKAS